MAKNRKPEKQLNHERWLVSYGDLLTLLFAVFVVLYAMSQADKKKTEEVMQSIQQAFGMSVAGSQGAKLNVIPSNRIDPIPSIKSAPASISTQQKGVSNHSGIKITATENEFKRIKSSIEAYLIKEGKTDKVIVDITRRGLVISLKEAGFFDSGSAKVKQQSISVIATIARSLAIYANELRIEGHTDNIPIRTSQFRSNWELSSARANNIMHLLTEAYGLEPERMSTVGNGEYRPIDTNDTPEGRAKNRRVDIVVLNSDADKFEAKSAAQ
ncbi:flagellar basal body stator protein MotB [Geotalea uraniireducens]|uniref:Flagellar basal body stator protein MotB n=1 Tax=Geotalea uraniireducens TaxID=351604 RepID=A0ABM8EPS4_9BACT|nr:flagellar motor protein MotB [Geotalea uraniireducens]BDV44043.1 flagellar basal body stator protein MotB [Geotalea uraniireducens]